jgi:hypothetical protein
VLLLNFTTDVCFDVTFHLIFFDVELSWDGLG